MRAGLGIVLLLTVVGCADPDEPPDVPRTVSRFEAGQVWSYRTREAEGASRITVLKVEYFPKVGNVVHVYLDGIGLRTEQAEGGVLRSIAHVAFHEDAIEASVLEKIAQVETLPKWQHAYDDWLKNYRAGRTPIMAGQVAIALDEIQEVLDANR